jgi:hypothetical protein
MLGDYCTVKFVVALPAKHGSGEVVEVAVKTKTREPERGRERDGAINAY